MSRWKIGRGSGVSFTPYVAGCFDTETEAWTEDGGDEGGTGIEHRKTDG